MDSHITLKLNCNHLLYTQVYTWQQSHKKTLEIPKKKIILHKKLNFGILALRQQQAYQKLKVVYPQTNPFCRKLQQNQQ